MCGQARVRQSEPPGRNTGGREGGREARPAQRSPLPRKWRRLRSSAAFQAPSPAGAPAATARCYMRKPPPAVQTHVRHACPTRTADVAFHCLLFCAVHIATLIFSPLPSLSPYPRLSLSLHRYTLDTFRDRDLPCGNRRRRTCASGRDRALRAGEEPSLIGSRRAANPSASSGSTRSARQASMRDMASFDFPFLFWKGT